MLVFLAAVENGKVLKFKIGFIFHQLDLNFQKEKYRQTER